MVVGGTQISHSTPPKMCHSYIAQSVRFLDETLLLVSGIHRELSSVKKSEQSSMKKKNTQNIHCTERKGGLIEGLKLLGILKDSWN